MAIAYAFDEDVGHAPDHYGHKGVAEWRKGRCGRSTILLFLHDAQCVGACGKDRVAEDAGLPGRVPVVLLDADGFAHDLFTHKDAVVEAEGVSP